NNRLKTRRRKRKSRRSRQRKRRSAKSRRRKKKKRRQRKSQRKNGAGSAENLARKNNFSRLQLDQSPLYFSFDDFEPGHARGRTAVRARDATRIQKQNTTPLLIARHVGVTMQNNIDIIRRNIRRNMLQPKSQTLSLKIDNQRPIGIPI